MTRLGSIFTSRRPISSSAKTPPSGLIGTWPAWSVGRNMSERRSDEQRSPDEFAPVLASAEQPLVVGGQAVNIWAELYAPAVPALTELAPFTSKDADIYGTRALAETLAHRAGWEVKTVTERNSVAVAILTKKIDGRDTLVVEVLSEINGLTADDLTKDEIVTLAAGRTYRIPAPPVLLKAKLYNLASLVGLDRPQDLRQTRMLMLIVPQYFNELHAEQREGKITVENLIGAVRYCRAVVHSGVAGNVSRAHRLDFRQLLPQSLRFASVEIQAAVREFLEGLPDISAVEPPDLFAK